MKSKLLFFGVIGTALVLALVGLLRDSYPTQALMPDPLQPFDPHEIGGISTTQLGQQILNHTVTEIDRGKRLALPWIYTPTGWGLDVDKEVADGTDIGDVTSQLDALCNSTGPGDVDILAQATPPPPPFTPFDWYERTTIVQGTPEDYLLPRMPPFSWLLRHRADMDNIWLGGTVPLAIDEVLNTVYTNVPWSPNQGTFVATTMLAGSPAKPNPLSAVCLDSPQNSNSITNVYRTPPLEGDSDGPCDTGLYECADAGIYGMWTQSSVEYLIGQDPIHLLVEKHKVNNGPEDGLFYEWWEAEAITPPGVLPGAIEASWMPLGAPGPVGPAYGEEVYLPKSVDQAQVTTLQLTCTLPGHYLVVLKNILWPMPAEPGGTKDTYPDDNAFTFVVQVTCVDPMGPTPETPEVDKEVIWIKPVGVGLPDPPEPDLESTPRHLQLVQGQSIAVTLDELKANHETQSVLGYEWLVAEVPDVWDKAELPPVPGHDGIGDISVSWGPILPPGFGPCPVASGDACISGLVDEPPGQTDVVGELTVDCPIDTPPGLYSVVVKAIDAPIMDPLTLLPDSKPFDNAGRTVIKVWCWPSEPHAIGDGIEDGSGLFPRWTAFENSDPLGRGDSRKPFTSPPSIRSDTNYIERIIDLQCYWLDDDACATCDADLNGYISPQESWNDPDLLAMGGKAVVDNDGDCLIDPRFAQPSHPVDETPALSGDLCPELIYSGIPNIIRYDRATDEDCDGLVDGIEKAWGSNPLLGDSDGDGATDFEEMFNFTNPLNPDTDGDGLLDKPEDDYAAAPLGGAANSKPEALVAGNCADGIDNDTDGRTDAADPGCDPTDSDSDGASDADERALDSDPYNSKCDGADSDGDKVIDDGCPDGPPAYGNPEASTPEAQIAGTCADGIDNDLDGKTDAADSGCKTTDTDSDGKTDFDEVGLGSIHRDEAGETADSDDNCPSVYNPDQANNEGRGRPNGPFIAGGVSSMPTADTMGDACDQDDDNDSAVDVAELIAPATDPYNPDTDGDRCHDGIEGYLGTDPTSSASKCPPTLTENQQKFFRACHWNLPPNGYDAGVWDAEYDGIDDDTELDPDGDGIVCPRTTTGDKDADNGASKAANSCSPPPCSEIEDTVEIKGYNTFASQPDSDGDGCEDWIEIADVNGDRAANAVDRTLVLMRAFGITPADPVSDAIYDVNKDGAVNATDGSLVGLNSQLKKSPYVCTPVPTSDILR